VNDDTLKMPAFTARGKLKQFDLVLANPPYSIKTWDRVAFESDKYGRNFLGTPPQGRADYAFLQHILASLDPQSGRCAILFPHGVLFREEEKAMREKLIKSDLVECIIGLGANLFFNAPMEACIMICRTKKSPGRRGQILLINAVNEVIRKNAQSFLEDNHIRKIADCYERYENMAGFSRVITVRDAEKYHYSLSIPLYVRRTQSAEEDRIQSVDECIQIWQESSYRAQAEYESVIDLLTEMGGKANA
jgi:type I restriction enzyme M protein